MSSTATEQQPGRALSPSCEQVAADKSSAKLQSKGKKSRETEWEGGREGGREFAC